MSPFPVIGTARAATEQARNATLAAGDRAVSSVLEPATSEATRTDEHAEEGAMAVARCRYCNGAGEVLSNRTQMMERCSVCRGGGDVQVPNPNEDCPRCNGTGRFPPGGNTFTQCQYCHGTGYLGG